MKKIIITLIIGLAFFSCKNALEEEPKSIAAETFYNTASEMETAIAAIYSPLRDGGAFGMNYISLIECFTDYQYGRGSWANNSLFQGLNTTNIGRSDGVWADTYTAIRNANIVIKNAPNGSQLTDDEKAQYLAEAKYLRAFSYFILVKNWAGVPIRTEDNMSDINVARSTSDEVYALIISDLEDAETNLPDAASVAGRATRWAAKTLLADVYFYKSDYSDAATKAAEVIASGKYSLVTVSTVDDYDKIFGVDIVSTTEEIFYMKYSHDNGQSYTMMLHKSGDGYCGGGGWYGIYTDSVSNKIIANWDQKDLRRKLWYNWNIGLGSTSLLTLKFVDPDAPSSGGNANDIPVYRYGDVLLMSAEADARSTGTVSSDDMEKLNMVHRRAYGYNPLAVSTIDFKLSDYSNLDDFVNLVIQERCYETVGEGKRWFDLKRLGSTKLKEIIKTNLAIDVADKHLLWPIPTAETNYNSAIDPDTDQNPGY
jgi:starch-binding outer membrane protein, SusD/RagB family